MIGTAPLPSPRLHRRGRIEAEPILSAIFTRVDGLHGFTAVAELKPSCAYPHMEWDHRLHGFTAVAELKLIFLGHRATGQV